MNALFSWNVPNLTAEGLKLQSVILVQHIPHGPLAVRCVCAFKTTLVFGGYSPSSGIKVARTKAFPLSNISCWLNLEN